MFYQTQFVIPAEQYQYQIQQEEQQRKELELLLYKHIQLQQTHLNTPPASPMSATLGHPNRSCASCKKRKVKCDRKTPSCTACQKSKHRCHYTSYSPPVLTEEQTHQADGDEEIKAIKQKIEELDNNTRLRWERFQKLMNNYQQPVKDERDLGYPTTYGYMEDDEVLFNMDLTNPVIPTSTGTSQQFALQQQNSPQSLQLSPQPIQVSAPAQVPYMLAQQYQQPNTSEATPFIQTQNLGLPSGNYSPYMKGTIVLNYNLNGMRPFLGRQMAPILQSMTGGQGPIIPVEGFSNVAQLQDWLREKFLNQEWTEEMESYDQDEKFEFELRPIYEEVPQHHFVVRQKFEVILHRADFTSSPTSVHGGDFQSYDYDDKHFSETSSNRSSIIDCDPTDIFLNKIYAFVRRFVRNTPWLRENFLTNRVRPSPLGLDSDGVFSDVVVEVRKISSYSPYQDLKLVQNNEDFIKSRLFF